MKNNFLKIFAASGAFALSLGVAINVNRKARDIKEVNAYSPSSLPTDIDLNDASDATIRNYYSSLNTLSTNERRGTNLLKNLKPILKNQQKYLSYDSTNSIWDAYCIVDRDWNKSPASSLPSAAGTYNPSTNKIINYNWGGNSSKYENPYLHALYYNRNKEVVARAYGDHENNTEAGINREHIWPKASGFDEKGSGGARGDIMHLWAAHGHTNNKHNRYYYGYVDRTKSYSDEASDFKICSGNLLGKSKTFGGSTSVFEPQDSDKGDIARACFYMVARYNYLSGSDSDGIDTNNPNLELVNNVSSYPSGAYTSTTTKTGTLGILQDLLEWNRIDPPDEFEIHRNNLCYNNFTNNRNPFIDFPEWAEYIWGKSEDGDYSSASTGYATPSSDTINDFSGDTPVPTKTLSSISISGQKTTFDVGDEFEFGGTVTAHYSDNTTADVTSSAKFSGYNMSNEGEQIITVSYTEGDITETINYTITVASSGGTTDPIIVSTTIATYASANGWSNGVKYTSVMLDNVVTASVSNGSTNTGKYYTNGNEWRFYQGENAAISISLADGYELDSITFTFNSSNNGILLDSSSNIVSSGSAISVSGANAIFTVGNSGTATNGQVRFTSISVTYHESGSIPPVVPTSITATVNKTFKVGEIISKSDITVEDDLGNTITDFSFANDGYQFTYEDAASGGALTNKVFANSVTYSDLSCSLTVQVQREAHSVLTTSIQHTGAEFKAAGIVTSYLEDQEVTVDGITFNVDGYVYNNTKLSLSSSKTMATGSVINTTPYPSGITNITINGATPDIQLSANGTSGWVDLDDALVDETNYLYFKIFYKNTTVTSYVNITSITVTYKGTETANSTANYIMYEDTIGQCENGKFENAKIYFQNMSKEDRQTFMTNDDYVISSARARFVAWATHLGKSIEYVDGDYIVKTNMDSYRNIVDSNDDTAIVVIVIALFTISLVGTLLLVKKKKMR